MMKGNSSMAQLSTWTNAMKQEGRLGSKHVVEDDADEYEEEFEDFEESEEVAEEKKAPAKAPVSEKQLHKSEARGAPMQHPVSSIDNSLARSITDPRAVRVQRVLKSGVLNLQIERFTHLNLSSTTPYDFYISELHRGQGNIRQVGVPQDAEFREVEVRTEEISKQNQAIQFSYSDDTQFFEILDRIHNKRNSDGKESSSVKSPKPDGSKVAKLSQFLATQYHSLDILHRSRIPSAVGSDSRKKNSKSILSESGSIRLLEDSNRAGSLELIRERDCTGLRFPPSSLDLFLSLHPYPSLLVETDLRPNKGVIAVWEVNKSKSPEFILETDGQPCSACFSRNNRFVLAGCVDGALNLWDLRESSSLHRDRDSVDLQIMSGIRKPSFSSHRSSFEINDSEQHIASIRQVESLDTEAQTSAQFASLDENGVLFIWITSENSLHRDRISSRSDIVLLKIRKIDLFSQPLGSKNDQHEYYRQRLSFFIAPVKNDPSNLLFACGDSVSRVSTLSQAHFSVKSFHPSSSIHSTTERFLSRVSCLEVFSFDLSLPHLFLVGREQGKLSLFTADRELPILSWDLLAFTNQQQFDEFTEADVIEIKTVRNSFQFFAYVGSGILFEFDLSVNKEAPVRIQQLSLPSPTRPGLVAFSNLGSIGWLALANSRDGTITLSQLQLNSHPLTENQTREMFRLFTN